LIYIKKKYNVQQANSIPELAQQIALSAVTLDEVIEYWKEFITPIMEKKRKKINKQPFK